MTPTLPHPLARGSRPRRAPHAPARAAAMALRLTAAISLPSAVSAEIVVHDAWMGAVPPTSKVGAVYLDIENTGDAAVSIGSALSPAAARIELHQSVHSDGGRVRMEAREALELAPGERVDFSSTGHHYMLYFDVLPVPAPGERIPLSISVNGGAAIDVSAEVRRPGQGGAPAANHAHHDHAHHGHDHTAHEHEHGSSAKGRPVQDQPAPGAH